MIETAAISSVRHVSNDEKFYTIELDEKRKANACACKEDEAYDPYAHRNVARPTSYVFGYILFAFSTCIMPLSAGIWTHSSICSKDHSAQAFWRCRRRTVTQASLSGPSEPSRSQSSVAIAFKFYCDAIMSSASGVKWPA